MSDFGHTEIQLDLDPDGKGTAAVRFHPHEIGADRLDEVAWDNIVSLWTRNGESLGDPEFTDFHTRMRRAFDIEAEFSAYYGGVALRALHTIVSRGHLVTTGYTDPGEDLELCLHEASGELMSAYAILRDAILSVVALATSDFGPSHTPHNDEVEGNPAHTVEFVVHPDPLEDYADALADLDDLGHHGSLETDGDDLTGGAL